MEVDKARKTNFSLYKTCAVGKKEERNVYAIVTVLPAVVPCTLKPDRDGNSILIHVFSSPSFKLQCSLVCTQNSLFIQSAKWLASDRSTVAVAWTDRQRDRMPLQTGVSKTPRDV